MTGRFARGLSSDVATDVAGDADLEGGDDGLVAASKGLWFVEWVDALDALRAKEGSTAAGLTDEPNALVDLFFEGVDDSAGVAAEGFVEQGRRAGLVKIDVASGE